MFESLLTYIKSLPNALVHIFDVLLIALIFTTAFTLVIGVWLGFCITRKRMNHIVEIQFFPPKITFKDNNKQV